MMNKTWKIAFALLALAVMAIACSDDDDDSYSYMSGSLSLTFPSYVNPGYTKTFTIDSLMTVYRSDGGTVGYRFTDPSTGTYDTLVTAYGEILEHDYTVTVPDSLDNLTLTLTAFAPSGSYYYSSSATKTFTVVKPGLDGTGSITNFAIDDTIDKTFTDERDGKSYYYSTVGETDWMRQNLGWSGSGVSYEECEAMDEIFGRFYTWEEAQTACPDGWRLPSDADWAALGELYGSNSEAGTHLKDLAGDLMENIYFNGTRMWEYWRDVNVTNAARLSIMPVGYGIIDGTDYEFANAYYYAAFWTADEVGDEGVFRYIFEDEDIVYYGTFSKTDVILSVRCVR